MTTSSSLLRQYKQILYNRKLAEIAKHQAEDIKFTESVNKKISAINSRIRATNK